MEEKDQRVINLENFVFEQILQNCQEEKQIYILGTLKGEEEGTKAILKLMKTPFEEEAFEKLKQEGSSTMLVKQEQFFANDIYRKFWLQLAPNFTTTKAELIFPATPYHIQKFTKHSLHMVNETADLYFNVVKPEFVDKMDEAHLQWMYNIIDNGYEKDRIIFENDLLVLEKDYTFEDKDIETLHLLVFPRQKGIKSIRDLTAAHLPLLKAMREHSLAAIKSTYNLDKSQIKTYFHYYPTYFHLHLHVAHVKVIEEASAYIGKAIFLDDVINNIEIFDEKFYQKATLQAMIKDSHRLFDILKKNGAL